MTAGALGEERPTLFLRKATGLVRGWSVRDSLIYACLATNFVTLGIYEFTFARPAFPKGQLITAMIIAGIWVSFLVIAYAGLVVTIPRAGGDYVWQSQHPGQRHRLRDGRDRLVVHSLAVGADLRQRSCRVQLFEPLWATLKWTWPGGGYAWFGTHNGIFVVTLDHDRAGRPPGLDRAWPATRRSSAGASSAALIGFAVVVILLLVNSHASFVSSFNLEAHKLFGVNNAYAATNKAAAKAGYTTSPLGFGPLGPTHAARPGADVLPAVAELGHHPVRRDPRRERLQTGVRRHVLRPVDHGRPHDHLPAADGQDRRLGLLPEPELDWTTTSPRSSASGRTRSCSPAGWCTTPPSRWS